MKYGFVKVAAATPIIRVSDCKKNTDAIIAQIKEANIEGAALVNFPELCITGYTCSDLFLQQTLLKTAESSVYRIIEETKILILYPLWAFRLLSGGSLQLCGSYF